MKYLKKTNKLFFEKYVNKVSFLTPCASYFRGKDLDNTKSRIQLLLAEAQRTGQPVSTGYSWTKQRASLTDIHCALSLISTLETLSDFTVRVEGQILGIYFNEDSTITSLVNLPGAVIREVSKPETLEIRSALLSKPKLIIRKEYSHKYKVTVSPLGDSAGPFKEWAEKLPKIKTTRSRYSYGGHFYVADTKTLSLCRIYLANKIRKVEEIVTQEEF